MHPFEPLFASPHLQTIAANYWKRPCGARRYPVRQRLVGSDPGVHVLVESQQPDGRARGDVLLIHGLEGSSAAGYMRGMAHAALEAGLAAHRLNLRSCGGTEQLCPTLYHSGLTSDALAVLRHLAAEGRGPFFLVGYSLGGNVALKLAGELGDSARELLAGVCAVSVPLDLEACARRIGERENRIYEIRFLRAMRARLLRTGRYRSSQLRGVRTLYDFDDRITAPAFGFRDAAEYYRTQSSGRFLDAIRVPALVLQARDDSFIPFRIFDHPAFGRNPCLELLAPEHGGHVGFLSRHAPRFWADAVLIQWITARIPPPVPNP